VKVVAGETDSVSEHIRSWIEGLSGPVSVTYEAGGHWVGVSPTRMFGAHHNDALLLAAPHHGRVVCAAGNEWCTNLDCPTETCPVDVEGFAPERVRYHCRSRSRAKT
jgi:hypothetical protein